MDNIPYNAVMMDLECMSTRNNAAIIAIGAVKFWMNVNQDSFVPDQLFHAVIDLESAQDEGLDIDASTVKWWLEQSKEAQSVLTGQSWDIKTALRAFYVFCPKNSLIFGNGATFDNVILRTAYEKCHMIYPTSYRNDMCYRTLSRMANIEFPKFEGVKHNALHDAMAQTRHLMKILEKTPWNGVAKV